MRVGGVGGEASPEVVERGEVDFVGVEEVRDGEGAGHGFEHLGLVGGEGGGVVVLGFGGGGGGGGGSDRSRWRWGWCRRIPRCGELVNVFF